MRTVTAVAPGRVAGALARVIDPELGLDVVDLGLVYRIEVDGDRVHVDLGVTTPACPFGHRLAEEAADAIRSLPEAEEVEVELVFEPPWDPSMLSERARRRLGWR